MQSTRNHSLILGACWLASVAAAFYAGGTFRSVGERTADAAPGKRPGTEISGSPYPPGNGAPEGRLRASPMANDPSAAASGRDPGSDRKLPVAERFKTLMAGEDGVAKMSGFLELLSELGDSEAFTGLLDVFMDDFNPRENGREFSMIMQKWADIDPRSALEYSKGIDDWQGRWAATTVLTIFVATNRDEAIAWARENGSPEKGREEDGNWMMAGVITGLARTDPDAATELARAEPRSRARGDMLEALLRAYLDQGEDAARSWATSLPDDSFKVGALSRLAGRLAADDLEATVKWAESLPSGEATPRVFSEIVERWAREDPNEAGTWLGRFPASPEMDEPRQTFAWNIRERDPESAIAWAATISNPEKRERATFELARDWVRREPEAAKPWVAASPLPDAVKKRLIGG